MKIDNMSVFQGAVTGNGNDEVGDFTISGNLQTNNQLVFTKQYIGKHAVNYTGTFTDNKVTGQWAIPSFQMQDNFELTKAYQDSDPHVPPSVPSLPNSTYTSNDFWKGSFNQNGKD